MAPPRSQRLKDNPNAQLQLPGTKRRGDFAKSAVRHVGVNRPEIHVIEHVEEVEPELKIAPLPNPVQRVVLQQAGVELCQVRIRIDVAGFVAFGAAAGAGKMS